MVKIQQTIVVGLGPLGRACVEHYKRRTLQAYGELPAIKLLVVDTLPPGALGDGGSASLPEQSSLSPGELVQLPLDEVIDAPQHARKLYPWLPEQLAEHGWGANWFQTRAAARLALHAHIKEIYTLLEHHFHQLGAAEVRDWMASKGFEITTERNEAALIVVAGLGDAAGSALLLDLTYLVHYLYRRAGLQTAGAALLFMPPITPSDPLAEARAYAALKELNAHMDHRGGVRDYPALPIEISGPPFNRGCYLLDTRNEKGLTLHSQTEVATLAGEWLFQTLLSPLKARIDEFAAGHNPAARIQGQAAVYSSLGMATYMLPVEALAEWCARRFSYELITSQLLKAEVVTPTLNRLNIFFNQAHLRPDDLINSELRVGSDGKPLHFPTEYVTRLKLAAYAQIVSAVQDTLAAIGKEIVPAQRRQIELNARRVFQDMKEVIEQEAASILREQPAGGLSQAAQFLERLHAELARFPQVFRRREAVCRGRSQQQANYLSQLEPVLNRAATSIPSYPIIGISIFGGLLAPLLLTSLWLWRGLAFISVEFALALIGIVWMLAFGGIAYTVWYTVSQVESIRDQYIAHLDNRFQAELDLILVQVAEQFYSVITRATEDALERLKRFTDELHRMARSFKSRLDPLVLCGEIDFALQRSVLTPHMVEELYKRFARLDETSCQELVMARANPLEKWQEFSTAEIQFHLLAYGRRVFDGLREQHVEHLLRYQLTTPAEVERLVHELHDKASPLWTYDSTILDRTPVLASRTFVGLERPHASELRQMFERVDPGLVFEASGDPHSLIVTTLRCGMPLFRLGRVKEFRQHYLETLKDHGTLLHIEDELALVPDLTPVRETPPEIDAASSFAVGLALGIIRQDDEGVYIFGGGRGKVIGEFAANKVDSAIMLGMDEALLTTLAAQVQATAHKNCARAIRSLESYMDQAQLAPWERDRIERYMALLHNTPRPKAGVRKHRTRPQINPERTRQTSAPEMSSSLAGKMSSGIND